MQRELARPVKAVEFPSSDRDALPVIAHHEYAVPGFVIFRIKRQRLHQKRDFYPFRRFQLAEPAVIIAIISGAALIGERVVLYFCIIERNSQKMIFFPAVPTGRGRQFQGILLPMRGIDALFRNRVPQMAVRLMNVPVKKSDPETEKKQE